MTELELLITLLGKEAELSRNRIYLEYEKDDAEKLETKMKQLEGEIELLIEELKTHPEKCHSRKAHELIILQLSEHIDALNQQRDFMNILKHQNMTIPNFYLGILLSDIHEFITKEVRGYNGRSYLFYSANPKECYDRKEMIQFLQSEVEQVSKLEDINYVSLRVYFEEFKKRLIEKFDN